LAPRTGHAPVPGRRRVRMGRRVRRRACGDCATGRTACVTRRGDAPATTRRHCVRLAQVQEAPPAMTSASAARARHAE
jgi:hypothetical protein